ncbi:hypothetical protein MRX96_003444 [Rhipicephalus microplus]
MMAAGGTTTSTALASPYHWPQQPAVVQPSYVHDQLYSATTVPTPMQPLAHASPPAAPWQRPNSRQVRRQCCGGIGHVPGQCITARQNVPPTCINCGQPGHMWVECPDNRLPGNRLW